MAYWLMKSEPDDYSIDDLKRDKREPWDGIRNYQARNFMRDDMQVGDQAFFYHSSCDEPGIVGIMEVASGAYPDPTQFKKRDKHFDPKSNPDDPRWLLVDVKYVRKLKRTITLKEIKSVKALDDMILVRRGNRLSIMPVEKKALEPRSETGVNRTWLLLLAAIAALFAVLLWTMPPRLQVVPAPLAPELPPVDVVANVVPGTEKHTHWIRQGERTHWSVIYLHGFSATRQETSPLTDRVAAELGANSFATRLAGHGLEHNALTDVSAEDWLRDTAEALAAGAALGDHVIVIATSTGATLAVALLDHPLMQYVDTLVFLSPNFGPRNATVRHATGPGGRILTRLMVGKTRRWTPQNERQGRFWTTEYPSAALIEMVRVLDRAEQNLRMKIPQRVLMFVADDDAVISADAARAALQLMAARDKKLIEVTRSGDKSMHILAGDIMSPETTEDIVRQIVQFVGTVGGQSIN